MTVLFVMCTMLSGRFAVQSMRYSILLPMLSGLSICMSGWHNYEPYRNGWTNQGDIWLRWGQKKNVLSGGPHHPAGKGTFGGNTLVCPDLAAISILNLIRTSAALMWPVAASTVATCYWCNWLKPYLKYEVLSRVVLDKGPLNECSV